MNQYREFLTATKAFMSLSNMRINLQTDLSAVNITKPRNVVIDRNAALFLPDEYKHLVCGITTGDGACLFHAGSLILEANESLSRILPQYPYLYDGLAMVK